MDYTYSALEGLADIEESGFNNQGSERTSRVHRHSSQSIEGPEMTVDSQANSPPSSIVSVSATPSTIHASTPAPTSKPAKIPRAVKTLASHTVELRQRLELTNRLVRRRERRAFAASPTNSTQRPKSTQLRALYARRRRLQDHFRQSTMEFVKIETLRLKLEQEQYRNEHLREIEKLRLESRRLDIEENRNNILAEVAHALRTGVLSNPSLLSTDPPH